MKGINVRVHLILTVISSSPDCLSTDEINSILPVSCLFYTIIRADPLFQYKAIAHNSKNRL
jgi:hypothetical protein